MGPALIDTDPGVDDALALLLAWGTAELAVRWITTVAGNVPVEAGTRNVFRLLDLRRPTLRPRVAAGAPRPLARPLRTATKYHGADGLGDLADWPSVTAAPDAADGAALIVEAARETGGALTLVALGPLTNVAIAIERDAAALARVRRVVAMGGAVDVPGNVTPEAEFNMHVDPEAAARVLAAGLPLDLVPLDATRQATLPREAFEAALTRLPRAYAERILRFTAAAFRKDAAAHGMLLHDPLAVGVAIDDTLVAWERVCLRIGRDGETRRAPGAPNCRVATRVDTGRFLALFLDGVCRVS